MASTPQIIHRSKLQHFVNTTPSAAATYAKIALGVKSAKINTNPSTSKEIYIDQTTGATWIESYAPTLPVTISAFANDAAFEFFYTIWKNRSTLYDAQTDIVTVELWKAAVAGAYPAEKQTVSVQIDNLGGEGGKIVDFDCTINYINAPVAGTFNPTTSTFTAS